MINNSSKYTRDVWRVKILNQKPTYYQKWGIKKLIRIRLISEKKIFNCDVLHPWTSSNYSNVFYEVLKCKKYFLFIFSYFELFHSVKFVRMHYEVIKIFHYQIECKTQKEENNLNNFFKMKTTSVSLFITIKPGWNINLKTYLHIIIL